MKAVAAAALCSIFLLPPGVSAEVVEKETVRKSFPVAPSEVHLSVDNIWGSIDVTAYPGQEIRLVAGKTLYADDAEAAADARREVKLDLTQSGNSIKAYVDGPFRCQCDNGCDGYRNGRRERHYRVQYDFHIEVPVNTALTVSTVNSGDITIRGTSGEFDVRNVNGRIGMAGVSGSGHVGTVNGEVRVTLARNPVAETTFRTINGDIDVTFQPRLSADVRVKTMHGDVFTDFDVSALPRLASSPERRNGHFVYRSDDGSRFRIGNGGPEFQFETLNGTIRIRSHS